MNINRHPTTGSTSSRKGAIAAGVFYLITHITSVGAAALYTPILSNARYMTGTGSDDALVIMGALFEVICALGIVGTAVALYPVVKKWNEGIAMGYVGLRTLEAGIIAVGVVPFLAAVTLRQQIGADTDAATLVTLGHTFVSFYNWSALLGPGLVCGMNTILMAYLMYKSRLVPRFIPILGLVGGPLIFVLSVAKMFGMVEPLSIWAGIAVIPIFAWELTLAIRLITRGFNTSTTSDTVEAKANPVLHLA